MEASLYFSVPEICITSFTNEAEDDGTRPILLLCRRTEHCDFINTHIITGNTIIAHLNIDRVGTLGIFLEVINPTGFIITKEDCDLIQMISLADQPPVIPINCLLTSITIGADFVLDPDLSERVIESRKKCGTFSVSFGYRQKGALNAFSSKDPVFIRFSEYSTLPSDQFVQSIIPDNNQVRL